MCFSWMFNFVMFSSHDGQDGFGRNWVSKFLALSISMYFVQQISMKAWNLIVAVTQNR